MKILYRALRKEEIDAGGVLIPKEATSFLAPFRCDFQCGDNIGMTEKHAVIDHQTNGLIPTRGVSTTTSKKIAFEKYSKRFGVVALINRSILRNFGIKEYVVNKILHQSQILHPEDDEVILVYEKDGEFPREIISEIIDINA
ncbi:hypothetical protein KQH27_00480 [bacterium]|nr:hypothetical protein [bacterium]